MHLGVARSCARPLGPSRWGLNVNADALRAALLDAAAQPMWATDCDDVIRFANPAAAAALSYQRAIDLLGRRSHETVHARNRDGPVHHAEACPLRLPSLTGERVASDLEWFVRRDGSMFPVSYVAAPLELPGGCRRGRCLHGPRGSRARRT